jgi:glycosyltransferase involved in cell wall biosynthesis
MPELPILSIVIPTKNRQRYCLSAIKSILNLNDERIQIVIQDNSDNESLKSQLPVNYSENRLKYRYYDGVISFVDNFNRAIELSDGEYVCIIGDDDGINPEIIDAALWAKANDVACITGSLSASYRWDNVGERKKFFIKLPSSSLTLTKFTGNASIVDLESSLQSLMKNGCTNYMEFNFPKLYHGIVSKKALENLKKLSGNYLKGLSPDIYASIALACTVNKFVVVDYPLTIPGVCAESASIIEGERKENSKELSKAPHFRGRTVPYIWEENVPKVYCVQTIWADSAFAAIREFGREDLILSFDDSMLAVNILDAEPLVSQVVYEFMLNRYPNKNLELLKKELSFIKNKKLFLKKVKLNYVRVKRALKLEEFKIIDQLENIEEATLILEAYLKKRKINLISKLNFLTKV